MTTANEVRPQWVVITPTLDRDHWFEAIRLGAQATGREALATWTDGFDPSRSGEDLVIVTDDIDRIPDDAKADIVVLMPEPWSALAAIEAETGQVLPTSAITASQRLAEAAKLGARHRLVRPDQTQAPGALLDLSANLTIRTPPSSAGGRVGSPAQAAIAGVFRDLYADDAHDGVVSNWPLELFNYYEASLIEGRLGQFDLTGRPRFLVTGPYLVMPVGRWAAKVRFSLDDDTAGRRFRLDWGGVDQWTEQHFVPDHGGLYEMELTYTFEKPVSCEVRLIITEGCFTGRVDFLSVTISKVPDAA